MTTVEDGYFELVQRFPLLPIDNDKQLKAANQLAIELAIEDSRGRLSITQSGYLSVLCNIIVEYENKRFDFGPRLSPVELIKSLVKDNGLTQADLAPLFGGQSRVSDFLAGKRNLSKTQIAKLAGYFSLSPAAFFPELASPAQKAGSYLAARKQNTKRTGASKRKYK